MLNYSIDTPDILVELADTPEMRRLSDIGMHCGCEYTALPVYKQERIPYTRLKHSIGVARIVWHFTGDAAQAAAGLLHDIAAPVFAHTIDFMNNDHMTQESTEEKTLEFIENSAQITAILKKHRFNIDDVSDYHKYPIADNDTPMLSSDRLEYTLGNGYLVQKYELSEIMDMYNDLTVAANEHGVPELCFRSFSAANAFAQMVLKNSLQYVSDADRFAMQHLAYIIESAIKAGVLSKVDLHTTERDVIAKLQKDRSLRDAWNKHTNISSVSVSPGVLCDRYCVNVSAKKRYIDPLVLEGTIAKRISEIDISIKRDIESFLNLDFNYWLYSD